MQTQHSIPEPNRAELNNPKLSNLDKFGLLLFASVWLLLWIWESGQWGMPEVQPIDAPETEFSAERAADALRRCMPEPVPHGMGSPAAGRIREGLAQELTKIGGRVEVQSRWVQDGDNRFARVDNLVAHFPGTEPGPELLALAHYDSVAAGPGENDDLAGCVAWIEALRALPVHSARFGVWVVFTEGEELGLFGARAFADEHPAMENIGLVVNLEARGSSGPSRLFETGLGNAQLTQAYGSFATHPSASSLSVEVYRRMPNGSDLTVFLERGLPGVNFAYIGDWPAYHSPMDTLERGGLQSLQHHGENVMAMLRALQAQPALLAGRAQEGQVAAVKDSVHVDLMGRILLRYSPTTQWWAAILGLGLVAWALVRFVGSGREFAHLLGGLCAWPFLVVLPTGLAYGCVYGLQRITGTNLVFWSRHLPAALLALACALLAGALLVWATRRIAPQALVLSTWIWQVVLGALLAFFIPGAGFLAVPLALLLGVLLHSVGKASWARLTCLCAVLSLFVWVPLHTALLHAFGYSHPVALMLPLMVPLTLLWPLLAGLGRTAGWSVSLLGSLAVIFVFTVGSMNEPYTVGRPGTLNLTVKGGELSHSSWPFQLPKKEFERWKREWAELAKSDANAAAFGASGPGMNESGAEIHWESPGSDARRAGTLFSLRGAQRVSLRFAKGTRLQRIVLQGQEFSVQGNSLHFLGLPKDGQRIEFAFDGPMAEGWFTEETVNVLGPAWQAWMEDLGGTWVPRHGGHRSINRNEGL